MIWQVTVSFLDLFQELDMFLFLFPLWLTWWLHTSCMHARKVRFRSLIYKFLSTFFSRTFQWWRRHSSSSSCWMWWERISKARSCVKLGDFDCHIDTHWGTSWPGTNPGRVIVSFQKEACNTASDDAECAFYWVNFKRDLSVIFFFLAQMKW